MKLKQYISRYGKPEGMPKGMMFRHTCFICGKKRYEKDMEHSDEIESNNYKSWLLWYCKDCPK